MQVLVGKVSGEDFGNWPFMVKGHQHWIFLDNGPFASESVLVFKFWFCFGPLVLGAAGG